jgi:hypothetical protein
VLLFDLVEVFAWKSIGETNQSRPKLAMYERDFALGHAANENIIGVSNRPGQRKYLFALGMRPPTPLDRPPRHSLRQGGDRSATGFEDNAVLTDERYGLPTSGYLVLG